jgi:ABC-type multidrug transport system ATPase subunit
MDSATVAPAPRRSAPPPRAAFDTAESTKPTTAVKPSAEVAQAEQNVMRPEEYIEFLRKLRLAWKDQPDVSISWTDLAYKVQVPHTDTSVQTLASAFVGALKKPFAGSSSWSELSALVPSSGVIKPATMTLILAPPGHGKTTLLKALSGRLAHDPALTGEVRFNNRTADENRTGGVFVNRLCAFVGQQDLLFPTLTVQETLDFAAKNSIPDANLLRDPHHSPAESALIDELVGLESQRADLLIGMLGLAECSTTFVGNDLLRGVSGGQRKRVTLGEMLLTNARCYLLDEVTTGLDAAVTVHIFSALKKACAINHAAVVTALLQPTPETYALFDEVILMRDGHIVYHGPREDLTKWLWETTGLEVPTGVDEAGFIVDYLTDPHGQYEQAHKNAEVRAEQAAGRTVGLAETSGKKVSAVNQAASNTVVGGSTLTLDIGGHGSDDGPAHVTFHIDDSGAEDSQTDNIAQSNSPGAEEQRLLALPKPVPIRQLRGAASSSAGGEGMYHSQAQATPVYTSVDLHARYLASPWSGMMQTEMNLAASKYKEFDVSTWGAYTRAQYGQRFPHSSAKHTWLSMGRQFKLTRRNRTMIPPRIAQAIIMGLVIGSLFYQLGKDKFGDKMGLLLCQ